MTIPMQSPPQTLGELRQRAERLAGKTIGDIASQIGFDVPQNLKRKKGWQGQMIEAALGTDSGNLSQPDFSLLGVELKTLPINLQGQVEESTYVSVLNLSDHHLLQWHDCSVYHKLSHVLWVPVAKIPGQAVTQSRIATPFFWKPNQQQAALLKSDWEAVMDLVSLGQFDQINARMGEILQVRPKAAHSRVTTDAIGSNGESIKTLPRGFYLRPGFTQQLLNQALKCD